MTVRSAELLMAIVTILISIALMVKSAELSIGWVAGRGPGAGAWPFWISTGLLLSSLATLWRWFKGMTPESRSTETFMSGDTIYVVGITVVALTALLGATHVIGIYLSLFFFLMFYLKVLGRHSWTVSIILTAGIPIFIFCLFEWALTIPLPKGISEPLFYPIYDLIY